MSNTYPEFSHTKFPDSLDDASFYGYLQDVSDSLAPALKSYQAYFNAGDTARARNILQSNPDLAKCMWKAIDYNWMRDAVLAMEKYYKDDIAEMVTQIGARTLGIRDNVNPGGQDAGNNTWSINKLGSKFVSNMSLSGRTLIYNSLNGSSLGSVAIPLNTTSTAGFVPAPPANAPWRIWGTNGDGTPTWINNTKIHDVVTTNQDQANYFWCMNKDGIPGWRNNITATYNRAGIMSDYTYRTLFNVDSSNDAIESGPLYWGVDNSTSSSSMHKFGFVMSPPVRTAHMDLMSGQNATLPYPYNHDEYCKTGQYFAILTVEFGPDTTSGDHEGEVVIHTSDNIETGIVCRSKIPLSHTNNTSATAFFAYNITASDTNKKIWGVYRHNANIQIGTNYNFCVIKIA